MIKNNYDKLIPIHPKREKVYKKFYDLLEKHKSKSIIQYTLSDLQKIALNIERGIFNYSVLGITKWDYIFENKYQSRCCTIFNNLDPDNYLQNKDLILRLYSKNFTEFELAKFNSEQLFPIRYAEIMISYIESQPKYAKKEEEEDGMHRCTKCKTYKTTYYQLQTRSAKFGYKSKLLKTYWLCFWENSIIPIINNTKIFIKLFASTIFIKS